MAIRVPSELTERDSSVLAPLAGLEYVPDSRPGLVRRRCGRGFTYLDDGDAVRADTRDRIERLAIPPAWTDVWISPNERGYLQASGLDDADRKQYLYHPEFRAFCERRKFERLTYFGRALASIRRAAHEGLSAPIGSRTLAVAATISLIDEHLLRVGNDDSAADGHHGATTLLTEHVINADAGEQAVGLDYVGKGGQERRVIVDDDDLADVIVTMADAAHDRVFWFVDDTVDEPSDERRRVAATDVNQFIVDHAGPAFTAKDFRTWGGSAIALERRACGDRLLDAIDGAAVALGNTRTVARSSYVHPAVVDADDDLIDDIWTRSRSSRWRRRCDSALAKLLTSS